MADKDQETPKKDLSDEAAERIRTAIIRGVGYGQPPKEHQFRKGQSGNPGGRPRGSPHDLSFSKQPILGAARRAATKKIKVREGDKVKEVSASEALIDAIFTHGVKGNARYGGMALDIFRTAEQAHAREVRENNEYWSAYRAAARATLAEYAAGGEGEPEVLPHPDDIVIDPETGPRFIGPIDKEELKKVQETQRLRDVLIMQDALDQRSTKRLDGQPLKEPGGALLFAMVLERALPPRLRLSATEMIAREWSLDRMSKRDLQKTLYREWRQLGRNIPRGFVFCDRSIAEKKLRFLFDFVGQAQSGALDVDAIANGEFSETAQAFFDRHDIRHPP